MSKMENVKLDGLLHSDEVAHISDGKIYAIRKPQIKSCGCSKYGAVTVDLNLNDEPDECRFVGFIKE